jgi:hypothetical protein
MVGTVGEFARARGALLDTRNPHLAGAAVLAGRLGGLIALGGPQHAGDDRGYPAFSRSSADPPDYRDEKPV